MILRSLVNDAEQTLTEARRGCHSAVAETVIQEVNLTYCCSSTIVPNVRTLKSRFLSLLGVRKTLGMQVRGKEIDKSCYWNLKFKALITASIGLCIVV